MSDIGDIIYDRLDSEGCLPCTGGMYSKSAYPELGSILEKQGGSTGWGSQVTGLPDLPGTAYSCKFSHDSRYLAIGHSGSPRLRVFDTSDWSVIATDTVANSPRGLSFSHDGKYLACAHYSGKFLTVLDMTTEDWEEVPDTPQLPGTGGRAVAYSPDDRYIVVAHDGDNRFTVVDTNDWSIVPNTPILPGNGRSVAYHPSGDFFVVGHYSGDYATVIETGTWEILPGPEVPQAGLDMSFSTDGEYLAFVADSADDGRQVYRVKGWSQVLGLPVRADGASSVSFGGDNRFIVDSHTDSAAIVNIETGVALDLTPLPGVTERLCWSNDNRFIGLVDQNAPPYFKVYIASEVAPAGWFYVPDIPMQRALNLEYPVLIQAEEE